MEIIIHANSHELITNFKKIIINEKFVVNS